VAIKPKHALAALFSALGVCAGLLLVVSGNATAANILSNPGFEDGNLSGWTCTGGGVVSTPTHSGTKALSGTPAGQDNARCSQNVAVKPNTAYKLTAWVQGSYVYLGAAGTGTTEVSTWTPGASSWTQLTVNFTTGAASTSVGIYVHGWYGQPTYFADDVSLDGPGGTPPTTTTKPPTSTTTTLPPSTTTTPPTTTTSKPPTDTALPKHLLTGYWQNFFNGAKALKLADVPTRYNIIAVSFADADTSKPGAVSFTLDSGLSSQLGGYTDAQFKADIKTVQSRGQKVIISVGGQNGTISVGDPTASANFANSIGTLIQNYGFDGVDIDLENGVNATHMGSALRSIYAKGGTVITMAPQTIDMQSTSGGYFQLALGIKDILTIVNMQYYNSGSMNGCNGQVYSQGSVDFLTALACIQLQGGLRADQVGIGVPASPQGAGSGYVSPTIVNNALDCLAKAVNCGAYKPATPYPAIRGAMTWSINWDASNNYAWANAVGGHLATLP
jgi:chitinase